MTVFWMVWGGAAVLILLLASAIEINGGRNGFQGANGIFLFVSAYLTVLSSPILFALTWIWASFLTALAVWLIGAIVYYALFKIAVTLITRLGQPRT
ncbi:hypothetical protein [Massilia sp. DWR3-1-1]|uniref:hypothetical protein n=1 Tax=Massilia sp. DWR3-1-1 TaxID=2804559 RepID=UPI003CE937D5